MPSPGNEESPESRKLFSRRNALKLFGVGGLGAAASVVDAHWIEPNLLFVTRKNVACAKLPPGLDGLRIGLLSDFHYRPGRDGELLDKAVARMRAEKPDIIALTGDYMSQDPRVVAPMLERLQGLHATHGIFAILGNHDGWSGSRDTLRRQFEKAGISFLINRNSQLSIRGEKFAVAGTDFVWLGKPDPVATLKGIAPDTPVLALVHEPDYFDTMAAQRDITLQVSGHTHGGQCRVPIIGYAPRSVPHGKKYVEGHHVRGNSNLFVTTGVGTTGPRVRFSCPPELAMLTLKAAKA